MYYRISDIKAAVYEVDDLLSALSNTAQTQLKEVFGNMTFTEALESQTQINEYRLSQSPCPPRPNRVLARTQSRASSATSLLDGASPCSAWSCLT